MKKLLVSSIITAGLMAFSPVSSAAIYDFQAWTDTNGEQGFDNSAPFSLTDSGLTLTATAFDVSGLTTVPSYVYMDGFFNVATGGMGVCTALGGTTGDQCVPSSDDNVSINEILSWDFSQGVNSLTLELGTDNHQNFVQRSIEYSLDGSNWLTATTDSNAMLTILVSGGTGIDFRTIDATSHDAPIDNQFYIRNADVAVVPVPAAVWLFGSGLIGLAGFIRRRK